MMGRLVSLRLGDGLHGLLDEFRISDTVWYTYEFDPPASFSRNYGTRPRPASRPSGPPLLFGPTPGEGVVALGSRKHLFIDEALVEKMEGVRFVVNPPGSYEVTDFVNDRPWEPTPRFGSTIPDVATIWDEGSELRMLYTNGGMWGGKPHAVCLAVSKDGLHWQKPVLGLKNWGGSTRNNIVLRDSCQGSVLKDPNPEVPAGERYKYVAWNMYWGFYVYTSADGIHWRRNQTVGVPFDPDGSISLFWDDQRGIYRAYIRALFEEGVRRRIAYLAVPDLLKPWPFQPVSRPYLADMMLARPISGELPLVDTGGQVYRFKGVKYPWAPDTYLAFPWRYVAESNVRPGSFLMVSRDGENWKRYEDPYYFAAGWELDGREVLEALMEDGMVRRGDRLWQFGTVRFTEHGGVLYGGREYEGGVHDRLLRLEQRLDGFVALEAGGRPGTVVTQPMRVTGDKLVLNLAARGRARVAVLDESGKPIPGLSLQDCDPIQTDSVRHAVSWRGSERVGSFLKDRVIRLQFELVDAKLFAFQFVQE